MALPLHSRLRQHMRGFASKALAGFSKPASLQPIPKDAAIKRILVIRINYRIGNILFTTPTINALSKRFPDAKIDVLVGASYVAPLLQGLPNVNKVIDFPRKLLKNPIHAYRYIQAIRATQYDLVLSLSGLSSSDRLATYLVRGTYKVGFVLDKDFMPYTHVVVRAERQEHEAIVPLQLMQALHADEKQFAHTLTIGLNREEVSLGQQDLVSRLQAQHASAADVTENTPIIGIFRNARFEKIIDNTWWQAFIAAMQHLYPAAVYVDILSPDVPEKLNDSVYSLKESNLRKLGAMLANMQAFVCGDTGPMHLASASKVPTIALFKATSPSQFGTLGTDDLSLEIKNTTPEQVAQRVLAHIQYVQTRGNKD